MSEAILSVGIDLGTTTTQMIVSRLQVENTAAPFTIPKMEIREREIRYRSPIHFTPLLSADTLDAEAIGQLIRSEYDQAGITPQQVQTGAVIITGETARKENARQVLKALSELAGDFVVATAGPALESVLAAKGAGADQYAKSHGQYVLHLDIGGGTSNLALFDPEGHLADTGCLNVGGRLLKFDRSGAVTYVSPVLAGTHAPSLGDVPTPESLEPLLDVLIQALEEAVGLRPPTAYLRQFLTDKAVSLPPQAPVLSFSGGVADCMANPDTPWLQYGDLGVLLGRAIRRSSLCRGSYVLGKETIRATVIGAGSHATELSGSTIAYGGVSFPLQNLPVASLSDREAAYPAPQLGETVRNKLALFDEPAALALRGVENPSYTDVTRLADGIAAGVASGRQPVVVVLEQDMGKALGQALRLRLGPQARLVCLDGLHIPEGSYLDIAAPIGNGSALPVVVKTLAFQ